MGRFVLDARVDPRCGAQLEGLANLNTFMCESNSSKAAILASFAVFAANVLGKNKIICHE